MTDRCEWHQRALWNHLQAIIEERGIEWARDFIGAVAEEHLDLIVLDDATLSHSPPLLPDIFQSPAWAEACSVGRYRPMAARVFHKPRLTLDEKIEIFEQHGL